MPQPRPLMTLPEVAKVLRCSPYTVRLLIQSGHLAAVRVGKNRVRVTPQALDVFLNPPPHEDPRSELPPNGNGR